MAIDITVVFETEDGEELSQQVGYFVDVEDIKTLRIKGVRGKAFR